MSKKLRDSLPETFPVGRRQIGKFIKTYCGEQLGIGIHRTVFIYAPDPNYVVKIMQLDAMASHANILEWHNYELSLYTPLRKWLAPCESMNQSGTVLIQRRVRHKTIDKYPEKIPSFLGDQKITNYGWIGNQLVCCDYPTLHLGRHWKLVKAKWWDVDKITEKTFNKLAAKSRQVPQIV